MRLILVASLAGLILAAALPHATLADPTDAPDRQSQQQQLVNDTYAAIRNAQPYVAAVALPVLHCVDPCYRSVRPTDDVVLSPVVERHRATSIYDSPDVADRSWTAATDVGGGALVEEESVDDTTFSYAGPNGTTTHYEAADRSITLLGDNIVLGAGESESRSTTTGDGATREVGGQHAGAGAATLGTPVGGTSSLGVGHSRSSYHNDTRDADLSDSGGSGGVAIDLPSGGRATYFLGVDLASDHPAKTTVLRVRYATPLADQAEQDAELPLVLP